MTQMMDHGMKLVQGLGGQMNKLNKQNSFHDIVCFAIQICPRPQKSVRGIRRTAVNRRWIGQGSWPGRWNYRTREKLQRRLTKFSKLR